MPVLWACSNLSRASARLPARKSSTPSAIACRPSTVGLATAAGNQKANTSRQVKRKDHPGVCQQRRKLRKPGGYHSLPAMALQTGEDVQAGYHRGAQGDGPVPAFPDGPVGTRGPVRKPTGQTHGHVPGSAPSAAAPGPPTKDRLSPRRSPARADESCTDSVMFRSHPPCAW